MNVQPSCCLDVVVYMLNCVFWRHILLEIEFKSRVDMGSESQIAFGYCTAVSPMSGSPTFDTGKKKNRNGANLKLRHTLRVGGVTSARAETYSGVSYLAIAVISKLRDRTKNSLREMSVLS